ncbi:MAG TPA: DNA ligase D [Phycisphaerales bacterium]|nr:DNA ligase D [Phycisphaerales bacterium]
MPLQTYRRKRHFERTSEPRGSAALERQRKKSAAKLQFVIQKHDATRLHYDFRLELDGVLKSWAVPKGPSLDPAERRLAVHVEDHPLEYGTFEGVIPEGQYGAGPVLLWDRGTWTPVGEEDPRQAYKRGRLKFELQGEKLRGAWDLVRMHGRADERSGRENWLLIKERDRFAKAGDGDGVVTRRAKSVKTGREIEQIGVRRRAATPSQRAARVKIMAPGGAKKTRRSRDRLSAQAKRNAPSREPDASEIPRARRADRIPNFLPQLATFVDEAPVGDEWLHEVKFDGYRILTVVNDGEVRLITRNGKDWTAKFGPVAEAVKGMALPDAVLDGEAVVMNERSVSSFQLLQRALLEQRGAEIRYFVFDLPYWSGFDLRECRLDDRRRLLKEVLAAHLPGGAGGPIAFSENIVGHGAAVQREACRLGLEGIVSKRADSPYESRRTRTWVKSKCGGSQELVIGGWQESQAQGRGIRSLFLGYYDSNGRLVHAGKVGSGFDEASLATLRRKLKALERPTSPFAAGVPASRKGAHWIEPKVVAHIAFTEWTQDGRLRHPVYLGLREDKPASEVRREMPKHLARTTAQTTRAALSRTKKGIETAPARAKDDRRERAAVKERVPARIKSKSQAPEVEGVAITHPDRVVFAEMGVTKLQVAEYYSAIGPKMMPYLEDRPVSLVRCPKGPGGTCFFQKHMDIRGLRGLRTVPIKESSGTRESVIVEEPVGLISLVQWNTLELHGWGSRAEDLEHPDKMVLDLDPGPGVTRQRLMEAAFTVKRLVESRGLIGFPLLTGGKGVHVVVPLKRRADWETVKAFARSIAAEMVEAEPDRYVLKMTKSERAGKIFVDYLRNGRGATSIVPYSTRAREGATVAWPVGWAGLRKTEAPTLTVAKAPKTDPWRDFVKAKKPIKA